MPLCTSLMLIASLCAPYLKMSYSRIEKAQRRPLADHRRQSASWHGPHFLQDHGMGHISSTSSSSSLKKEITIPREVSQALEAVLTPSQRASPPPCSNRRALRVSYFLALDFEPGRRPSASIFLPQCPSQYTSAEDSLECRAGDPKGRTAAHASDAVSFGTISSLGCQYSFSTIVSCLAVVRAIRNITK